MKIKLIACLLMAMCAIACTKDVALPIINNWAGLQLPTQFGTPVHSTADNPITQDGFALGK
jgi:hypothetical protein